MKTRFFNELDCWLVQNWPEAIQLEQSMYEVREKYEQIWERIVEAVQAQHPELNDYGMHCCRAYGEVGFGRSWWPRKHDGWPTGFYISGIDLETLTERAEWPPGACIWFNVPKTGKFNSEKARAQIRKASGRFLGKQLRCQFDNENDIRMCLWYDLPESKEKIRQMLLHKEAKGFSECMVSHVSNLAKFIPVVDELCTAYKGRSRNS